MTGAQDIIPDIILPHIPDRDEGMWGRLLTGC